MPTPILQTLFGGGEDTSGLLDPTQANTARRQGLLNAGISMLEASAPSPTPKSFAGVLAAGLRGGQAGYEKSTQGQVARDQVAQQLRMQRNRMTIMQQFAPQPGETPVQRLDRLSQAAQALLAGGDVEGAGKLSSLMSAMHEQALRYQFLQGPEGALDIGDPSTGQIRHVRDSQMPDDLRQLRLQNLQLQRERLMQTGASHEDNVALQWVKNFETQNKTLMDAAFSYSRAKTIIAAAETGNPAATKTALFNYVRVSDPNTQMRQGILQFLENIDASFKGQSMRWIMAHWDGTIPADQLANMKEMVTRLEMSDRARYSAQRQAYTRRHPDADPYLMSEDDLYGNSPQGGEGEDNAGDMDSALGGQ